MGTEYILTADGELYHWGIKGMKWGERRYQNKDGSLTEAGKKRYYREADKAGYTEESPSGQRYKKINKGKDVERFNSNVSKWVDDDMQRSKKVVDDSANLARNLKSVNDKTMKNQPRERLDLSKMSDQELRNQINRELLERQYNDVFNPPKINKGRETASKVLETAGDVLLVAGSAVGLALSIRQLVKGE
jgi:hypothetical protein